jgi:hypothetical protein
MSSMRSNKLIDTDAQVRPAASRRPPFVCAGHRQR